MLTSLQMNKYFLVVVLMIAVFKRVNARENTQTDEESGRVLIFWNGGTVKFIVGWSIPVPNHTPFVTLFIHTIQMAYPVISNATQLHDFLQEGIAKGVRYTKKSVFFLLDRFLSSYGNLNRQCLTRFICELSQISIGHQFTADILTYIFKPPDDKGKFDKAWKRGKVSEDCEEFYYCPFVQDFLTQFTTVQYL